MCVDVGDNLVNVFMYTEKKCHRFTETPLPLPLTSDRDYCVLQVENRVFENAFNLPVVTVVSLINSTDAVIL